RSLRRHSHDVVNTSIRLSPSKSPKATAESGGPNARLVKFALPPDDITHCAPPAFETVAKTSALPSPSKSPKRRSGNGGPKARSAKFPVPPDDTTHCAPPG